MNVSATRSPSRRRSLHPLCLLLIAPCVAAFSGACDGGTPAEPGPEPASILLLPAPVLLVGQSHALSAAVLDVGGRILDVPVVWSSTDATTASVDADGTVHGLNRRGRLDLRDLRASVGLGSRAGALRRRAGRGRGPRPAR